MKYRVSYSGDFKRDFKRVKRQGCDMEKLEKVLELLVNGEKLPPKYRDHKLDGEYLGTRECHIAPDWLLIYEVIEDELVLYLTRTGSHAKLFKK